MRERQITFRVSEEEYFVLKNLSNNNISEYIREKIFGENVKIKQIEKLLLEIYKKVYLINEMTEEIFCHNEENETLFKEIKDELKIHLHEINNNNKSNI